MIIITYAFGYSLAACETPSWTCKWNRMQLQFTPAYSLLCCHLLSCSDRFPSSHSPRLSPAKICPLYSQCRMVCRIRHTRQLWPRTIAVNFSMVPIWVRRAIHSQPFRRKRSSASLIANRLADVYAKMPVHRYPNPLVRLKHIIDCVRCQNRGTFSIWWPDWPYPRMPPDPFWFSWMIRMWGLIECVFVCVWRLSSVRKYWNRIKKT